MNKMMVFKVSSVKTRKESVFRLEGLRKCGSKEIINAV